MNTEHTGIEDMDPIGVQNDGEPVAVVSEPEPTPEPEPKAEDTPEPEPEKTPEEIEEHKRLTGSARAKAKAERLAEENRLLKERLDRLESKVDPKPANATQAPGEPKLEDFDTFADYNKAAIRYEAQKIIQEEKAESEAQRQRRELDEKAEKAKAKYDDFAEVMQELPQFPPAMASVISASEFTADLLYHLGTNPEESKRIASLPPGKQALEVAKLERKFEAVVPPPPKKETKAPPPLVPVKAAATPVKSDRFSGIEDF